MAPKGKGKAKAAPAPAAAFSAVPTLDEACALLLKNEPAPFREATETLISCRRVLKNTYPHAFFPVSYTHLTLPTILLV